jgi:hypothetical protein
MKKLRIVYAGPDGIDQGIADYTRYILGLEYDLKFTSTWYAEEALEVARKHDVDIFILFLNSIFFIPEDLPAEERLDRALSLIVHLKARYRGAVIGLYAYPDNPYFPRRAKMAGVDYLFRAPFDPEDFRLALEACLENVKRKRLE